MRRHLLAIAALAAAPFAIAIVAGQQAPASVFTAEQATAGRAKRMILWRSTPLNKSSSVPKETPKS